MAILFVDADCPEGMRWFLHDGWCAVVNGADPT